MAHASKIYSCVAALMLIAAGCAPRETKIVILSLNDLHAHIDNLDRVAAYVSEQRAANPNLLLLSAGDLFSGNPVVDAYSDKGFPMIDLMNDVHFDASTFGNHEFDYGQKILAKRVSQANFPFICANMRTDSSPLLQPAPCLTFTLGGEKVSVIGLIQEHPDTHRGKLIGLTFGNPQQVAKRYADSLRAAANVLVALTHIGFYNDSLLAAQVPQLDIIVGGHSHTRLDSGVPVNGVLVTQAGRYVQYIGRTEITLRGGKVVSRRNRLVEVAQLTQRDTAMSRKIREFNSAPEFREVVATLKKDIVGDVQIGNFFCDIVRRRIKADIVLQNEGGIRVDTLRKGALTKYNLYAADPFGNELILFEMSADDLRTFVRKNYESRRTIDLCTSGLRYKIHTNAQNDVTGVDISLPNGKPLSKTKRYTVAMNSYMATNPADYPIPNGDAGRALGITQVEAIIEQLKVEN